MFLIKSRLQEEVNMFYYKHQHSYMSKFIYNNNNCLL